MSSKLWGKLGVHTQSGEFEHLPYNICKIIKIDQRITHKPNTIQLLEYIKENLHDIRFDKNILAMRPKKSTNVKIDKFDCMKILNVCGSKERMNIRKSQQLGWSICKSYS